MSFVAYVISSAMRIQKLYPEQQINPRFRIVGSGYIYLCCNKHGLFKQPTPHRTRV